MTYVTGHENFHKRVASALAAALLVLHANACAETHGDHGMQLLSDDDMASVGAQAGVAIDLDFRINALANGDPIACPTVGSAATCRLAISLADRSGMWMVMKNYRGIIRLTNIWMDASNLPNGWTAQTSNGSLQNPALGGYDPNNKPALQLTAGNWSNALASGATAYNTYLNTHAYNELAVALNIEKLSAEFSCGGAVNNAAGVHTGGCNGATPGWEAGLSPTQVPGYLRDAVPGSAISLRMADGTSNPNAPAQIRLDGRLQVFGY